MSISPRVSSASDLLNEASQWHLLSLLLLRPTSERKQEVRRLIGELNAPRLREIAGAWCDNADEGSYLHLLGPGGLVPAREVAYRPFSDPGWLLADIARYHDAFGFHAATEEPADHIAVLTDFVAYLLLKETFARESDDELATVTREAMNRFVDEHLVPVAARMADRVEACGATDWSAAMRLLADTIPAPPPAVDPPEVDEQDAPCGACGVA